MPASAIKVEQFNYDETIKATIEFIEIMQKSIHDFKGEQVEQFKKTLVDISKQLSSKYSTYISTKPIAQSASKDFADRGMGVLVSVLHTTPDLINELSTAIKKYCAQASNANIESIRKQLLLVLGATQDKEINPPSELDSLKLNLHASVKAKLELSSFSSIKSILIGCLIELAKRAPINDTCPFTQDPIEERFAIYTVTGHKFEILPLLMWQCKRPVKYNMGEQVNFIKYLNPFTNKPFSETELVSIKVRAILLGIELSSNPTILFQACEELSKRKELEELCTKNQFDKIKLFLLDRNGKVSNPLLADRALSDAAAKGNFELVKFLLELGISPNHPLNEKRSFYSPLMRAAIGGHIAIMELLIKHQANVNFVDRVANVNALYFAVTNKDDVDGKAIKLLLDNGAEVNTSVSEKTVLWCAAFGGNVIKAQLLLRGKAKINGCYDLDGRYSVLHAGIMSGKPEMVQFLLDAGADIFDKCKTGKDALAFAKVMKREDIAKIILDHKEKLDKKQITNSTAIPSIELSLSIFRKRESGVLMAEPTKKTSGPFFRGGVRLG